MEIFRGSYDYFLSRAAVATYTAGGGFFLGVFSTQTQLAYFSVAEQLYRGAQGLFAPIAQAIYPFMARTGDRVVFFRVFAASAMAAIGGAIIGVTFGQELIELIFGEHFLPAYESLLLFLGILVVNIPSVLLGYPYLGAVGRGRFVNKTVIAAGVVQLVLLPSLLLVDQRNALGVLCTIF